MWHLRYVALHVATSQDHFERKAATECTQKTETRDMANIVITRSVLLKEFGVAEVIQDCAPCQSTCVIIQNYPLVSLPKFLLINHLQNNVLPENEQLY